jgi:hypothetical protein
VVNAGNDELPVNARSTFHEATVLPVLQLAATLERAEPKDNEIAAVPF